MSERQRKWKLRASPHRGWDRAPEGRSLGRCSGRQQLPSGFLGLLLLVCHNFPHCLPHCTHEDRSPREVKWLHQGHTAGVWQGWDGNTSWSDPRAKLSSFRGKSEQFSAAMLTEWLPWCDEGHRAQLVRIQPWRSSPMCRGQASELGGEVQGVTVLTSPQRAHSLRDKMKRPCMAMCKKSTFSDQGLVSGCWPPTAQMLWAFPWTLKYELLSLLLSSTALQVSGRVLLMPLDPNLHPGNYQSLDLRQTA